MTLPWLIVASTLAMEPTGDSERLSEHQSAARGAELLGTTSTGTAVSGAAAALAGTSLAAIGGGAAAIVGALTTGKIMNFFDQSEQHEQFVNLGHRIEVTRRLRKMTQESCATKAGISRTALRNLEEGNDTKLSTLWAVSNVLQIPISALFEELQPELEARLEKIVKAKKREN